MLWSCGPGRPGPLAVLASNSRPTFTSGRPLAALTDRTGPHYTYVPNMFEETKNLTVTLCPLCPMMSIGKDPMNCDRETSENSVLEPLRRRLESS